MIRHVSKGTCFPFEYLPAGVPAGGYDEEKGRVGLNPRLVRGGLLGGWLECVSRSRAGKSWMMSCMRKIQLRQSPPQLVKAA